MGGKFTLEQIREYWTQQAITHEQSPTASWTDVRVMEMEIRAIERYLRDGNEALEVGGGNGFSTVQFAMHKAIEILGIDYIPELIKNAKRRLNTIKGSLRGRVEFATGNVLHLPLAGAKFDKVISVRVIINLGDWPTQLLGLRECARMVKPGGLLLLSEATVQGWRRMNAFRREWRLEDIPVPSFNHYLDEELVARALSEDMDLKQIVNFSSTYYVGTRVLKPLIANACGLDARVGDPDMEWNRWFSQLPPAGDYGTQKLFVFRKK